MTIKIDIAIKTIDRSPRRNFLGETLTNLKRSGVLKSEHLGKLWIVDGGSKDLWSYLHSQGVDEDFLINHGDRTLQQNAQRCIELVSRGNSKWCLVLEDDLDVCDRFLESVVYWLEEHQLHGTMMYVFGANYDQIALAHHMHQTSWAYPCQSFYGALACAWLRETAADLAKWLGPDPFLKKMNGDELRTHAHDLKLGQWGIEQGLHFFLSAVPNFIQHIGVESSLGNKQVVYPAWPGREWSYA